MVSEQYGTMFAVEGVHWWYVGMQRITTSLVAQLYPDRNNLRILDAGCGTGAAMQYLSAFGLVTGCDVSSIALRYSRKRGLERLSQASVTCLPFCSDWFDLVSSFDVLYHRAVADYPRALGEFNRVLRPGGRILLRLPAYDWLRGRHDKAVHTAHRFTAGELHSALVASGFAIEKLSYANTLLFPLALGKRLLERALPTRGQSEIRRELPPYNAFFVKFLFAEAKWLVRHSFPFGLSVIAIGRKPEERDTGART